MELFRVPGIDSLTLYAFTLNCLTLPNSKRGAISQLQTLHFLRTTTWLRSVRNISSTTILFFALPPAETAINRMMTSTTPNGFNMNTISIPEFVKSIQKQHGLTQADASKKQVGGCGLYGNWSREKKLKMDKGAKYKGIVKCKKKPHLQRSCRKKEKVCPRMSDILSDILEANWFSIMIVARPGIEPESKV